MPVAPGKRPHALRPERVQADRDSSQTGPTERLGLLGEEQPVGRQCEIANALILGEHRGERGQIVPQQRLAPSQPHLLDAEGREDAHEPRDFLEREDRLLGQPDVLLLGHAVAAAKVAAVGD